MAYKSSPRDGCGDGRGEKGGGGYAPLLHSMTGSRPDVKPAARPRVAEFMSRAVKSVRTLRSQLGQ